MRKLDDEGRLVLELFSRNHTGYQEGDGDENDRGNECYKLRKTRPVVASTPATVPPLMFLKPLVSHPMAQERSLRTLSPAQFDGRAQGRVH